MKIRLIVIMMLFLFGLPKITTLAQNRNVVWVHGFGGDATMLQHYADIFANERRINSVRQTYNTLQGLTAASNDLKNKFTNTSSTNIGIGHSMGGVIIREVDRTTVSGSKRFGGFITLAANNHGSPVSQSIIDGDVNSATATAFDRLTAGPASLIPVVNIIWPIISGWTTRMVADAALNYIPQMNQVTNNDLRPGSKPMKDLNDFNSTVHRISIIAEETSPVNWRMIGSTLWGASHNGQPADDAMVSLANQMRGVYNSRYVYHNSYLTSWYSLINPLGYLYHKNASNQWKKGRDWFDQSQVIWCTLIKSTRQVQQTQTFWQFIPCTNINCCGLPKPILPTMPIDDDELPVFTDCGEFVLITQTWWVTILLPNDGLLPVTSQELKGVPIGSPNRYFINHANHMEVRNMSFSRRPNGQKNDAMYNTLEAIFERTDWFNTPRRTP
jgi:hypothetical protein